MSSLGNFVWSIADLLRGVYKPHQYGSVILPMTILRRLDCVLEPTREQVRKLAESTGNDELLRARVKQELGLSFYNISPWSLKRLVGDPDSLATNLVEYLAGFSANVDVFERFKFENEIAAMAEKNRLLLVVTKFAEVDLHPERIPNAEMGDLFEELIRKFAEASNETAGEHFTPRDAIGLMVDLLFAEDDDGLREPGIVRAVYDPTAGTGGMLSVAEDHLLSRNPDARLRLYGQEINDQSYAICKSDMIVKGQDATNIRLGDTLVDDLFAGTNFDYCLSNPPYGVDWRASEDAVKNEVATRGAASRFAGGLPAIGDGQMLFLQHLASKMRPVPDGGGRAGIVLNGSPLFNGGPGSGPSEIRRWLLENDLVDAIVALPTNMFYNTGISTYVWILDNTKPAERVGKVQLIDGSGFYTKMRKNLGAKSRELSAEDRDKILAAYDAYADNDHSNIFSTDAFGYWTITLERPLKLNFACTPERIERTLADKKLATTDIDAIRNVLNNTTDELYRNRDEFLAMFNPALTAGGVKLSAAQLKALWQGLSERDETADPCLDRMGEVEPDTSLRDTENVPFTYNGSTAGPDGRDTVIKEYFEAEVLPYVPDAWVRQVQHQGRLRDPLHPLLLHLHTTPTPGRDRRRPGEAGRQDPRTPAGGGRVTTPLGRLVEINPNVPEFLVDPDAEVTFMPLECVGPDGLADTTRRAKASAVANGYTQFRNGDILVPKITPTFEAGRTFPVQMDTAVGAGTTELHVLRARPGFDARFVAYVCRSQPFLQDGATRLQGVGNLRRVPHEYIAKFPVHIDDQTKQREIAHYLDRETAKIDTLIEEQQRLIEMLHERRVALIERTVARGLDNTSETKSSTLAWSDVVPAHWTVANIRRFATMKTGHTPSRSDPDFWVDCMIPWFTLADVWQLRDGRRTYLGETANSISEFGLANSAAELLPARTVVLSRTASVGFTGMMPKPMATSQDFWNWICGPELLPEFLVWTFRAMSREFESMMIGSTHKTIYQPGAASMRIPVPPLYEQRRIVAYLDEQTAKIDELIKETERFIELSQERRAALITAAVTGQVDMREAA